MINGSYAQELAGFLAIWLNQKWKLTICSNKIKISHFWCAKDSIILTKLISTFQRPLHSFPFFLREFQWEIHREFNWEFNRSDQMRVWTRVLLRLPVRVLPRHRSRDIILIFDRRSWTIWILVQEHQIDDILSGRDMEGGGGERGCEVWFWKFKSSIIFGKKCNGLFFQIDLGF